MDKIKILLADDHVVVREGFREIIRSEDDMEIVGEAGNGEEAIQMASQMQPDVILMDIAMPKVNGIEATKQIKETHPSTSILVLTAYDNEEFIVALVEAGAAGYLLKNVRGRELVNSIRAVHDGEAVLQMTVANKVFSHLQSKEIKQALPERVEVLSQRETEVLTLAEAGLSNKEIASELSLGVRTIQTHWRNIFNKMGISSRTEAILYGLREGWIELGKGKDKD